MREEGSDRNSPNPNMRSTPDKKTLAVAVNPGQGEGIGDRNCDFLC